MSADRLHAHGLGIDFDPEDSMAGMKGGLRRELWTDSARAMVRGIDAESRLDAEHRRAEFYRIRLNEREEQLAHAREAARAYAILAGLLVITWIAIDSVLYAVRRGWIN